MSYLTERKPWIVKTRQGEAQVIEGEGGSVLATLKFGRTRPLHSNATGDAHLMAAAPELLEACKKARNCASIPDEIQDILRKAIKKAYY